MSDMIMPYGKFKGKPFYEIPSGYLKWLAENVGDERIAIEADEEYQHREKYGVHWYDD